MKNSFALTMLVLIVLSSTTFFSVHRADAAEPTLLKVVNPITGDEWLNFSRHEKSVGDTFIVNVTIVNIAHLCSWQFGLAWNASLLECVNVTLPSDNVFAYRQIVVAGDLSNSGLIIYSAAVLDVSQSFSGSGVLAQVEFRIIEKSGHCDLAFEAIGVDTFLLDSLANDLQFEPVNAHYSYAEYSTLQAVNPLTGDKLFNFTTPDKKTGDTFLIDIEATDFTDLASWQFVLTWNSSLLAYSNATIPPNAIIPPPFEPPLIPTPDDSVPGRLVYGASLPLGQNGFTGSGLLAQVELKITADAGQSALDFENISSDTYLLDSNRTNMALIAQESYYILNNPTEAPDGFSLFSESCTVNVHCANATISVDSKVSSDNTSIVHFPTSTDMNLMQFEKIQSISLQFSATQSILVYTFANTTETDARSNSDATKSSLETAFNASFTWQSAGSSYGYFFNETYTGPAKQNMTDYVQFAMSQCLAPDLGGFSTTFTRMIQKPGASLTITASKESGSFDWTYSMDVAYTPTLPSGSGDHTIDLLDLLNVSSIAPSPYAGTEELMSVMLMIYTDASVSYVGCEPSLAPTALSRGWTYYSYIPQLITAFFNFGNDTSPVNQLSFTFSGTVVPEFPNYTLPVIFLLITAFGLAVKNRSANRRRRPKCLQAPQS